MTTAKPSNAAAAVDAIQAFGGKDKTSAVSRAFAFKTGWTLAAATSDVVCFACHFGPGPRI